MRAHREEYVSEMKHVDVSEHDGPWETDFLNRVKESLQADKNRPSGYKDKDKEVISNDLIITASPCVGLFMCKGASWMRMQMN